MKKLPAQSEASNVLVGEVDFLVKPITAFIRLQKGVILGDLTEIAIPTKFLFIMMGPAISPGRYHEIGRSISTLMADEVRLKIVFSPLRLNFIGACSSANGLVVRAKSRQFCLARGPSGIPTPNDVFRSTHSMLYTFIYNIEEAFTERC